MWASLSTATRWWTPTAPATAPGTDTIAGSSGAISGYGVPSSGFAAGGPLGYASGNVVVDAIEAATGNEQIREAMALGSWMESRWNPTALQAGGPGVGAFQFSPPSAWGLTVAEAENPTDAVKAILPSYASAVSQVGTSAWQANAELASEEAAVLAERPATSYYTSQGTSTVNAGWAATLQALGVSAAAPAATTAAAATPAAPPTASNTGTSGPGHEVRIQAGAQVPDLTGFTTGTSHNILVAADMVPTAAAGQLPYWYTTGSTPPAGSPASIGLNVAILADSGAPAAPIEVPEPCRVLSGNSAQHSGGRRVRANGYRQPAGVVAGHRDQPGRRDYCGRGHPRDDRRDA